MEKKQLVYILACAVLCLGTGFLIGSRARTSGVKSAFSGKDASFREGWEAARTRLDETGACLSFPRSMPDSEEKAVIDTLSGEAVEVKGSEIRLKVPPLEPLAWPELDERIVKVVADTKLVLYENKSPEAYAKEYEAYRKKYGNPLLAVPADPGRQAASSTPLPAPPSMYREKQAKLADIKAGSRLVVKAKSDIKEAKEFETAEIIIQPDYSATQSITDPSNLTMPSAMPPASATPKAKTK